MATRTDYLAEQLHRLLSGGDPPRDSPWSRTELRLVVEQAVARVGRLSYWENLRVNGDHWVDGLLTVPFNALPLTQDAPNLEWVATLPAPYLSLPGGRGLQRVRFTGRPKEHLVPAPSGMIQGSRVAKALGSTYEVVGLQIRVSPRCQLNAGSALDVRVVTAKGGTLPEEMEMAALSEALKLVQARQRPDLTNDDNPTP